VDFPLDDKKWNSVHHQTGKKTGKNRGIHQDDEDIIAHFARSSV
jgi:ABC-type Fe2+-enterobactin transport system substrate-binding protein